MADAAAVETAIETPAPAPVIPAAERPKPTLESTFSDVDWGVVPEDARAKIQEEMDRRIKVARENADRRARKERDAFWKGRESVRPAEAPKPAEAAPEQPKEPVRGDFESYEAYIDARTEFRAERVASAAYAKAENAAKEKQAAEARTQTFTGFQAKVRAKFPDIEERLESIGHIKMPDGMGEAIAESDLGPEILDFFANNPKDCERIAGLSPSAALKAIGRIEERLEKPAPAPDVPDANGAPAHEKPAAATPPAQTPTKVSAPAPIRPGGGTPATGDADPNDKDSIDDWMRKERARMRKKHG